MKRFSPVAVVLGTALVGMTLTGEAADKKNKTPELPPLFDRVRVEVVNVDVVVTDKRGVPISGLGPEDFIVVEDGTEREISNFFAFTDGQPVPVESSQEDSEAGQDAQDGSLMRRMAILFDFNTLDSRTRDAAVESIERFIREQFDGSYEWAVIGYGSTVKLLQPFTSDKLTVIGALDRLKTVRVQTRQARATDQTFTEDDVIVTRLESSPRRQAIDQIDSGQLTAQDFELRERMMQGIRTFSYTAAAMVETMRAYATLPGRKSMVLVSGALEGLPSGPQLLGFGMPGVGSGEQVDPLVATFNTEMQEKFSAIVHAANAAGFAIYPVSSVNSLASRAPQIDVAREQSVSFNVGGTPTLSAIDIENVPSILAEGTGGVFYSNTRFFKAFDDIDHRTANAYVLGFQTDHPPDRKYHQIVVRTRTPGLVVDSREGYFHLSQRDRLIEEMATPLLFPKAKGDFDIAVQVQPPEEGVKEKISLTVAGVVGIGDITLVPQDDDVVGRVFLLVAVYNEKGQLHKMVREQQELRFAASRLKEFPENAPARFALDLEEVERGDYTVTMTVMDEVTDRFGTGLQPVKL